MTVPTDSIFPSAIHNLPSTCAPVLWGSQLFQILLSQSHGLDFQENRLEDDFQKMGEVLLGEDTDTFPLSRFPIPSNVTSKRDGEPWFIDFKGGRRGPIYYDVASFLWQAKANYPSELRHALIEEYLDALVRIHRHGQDGVLCTPASFRKIVHLAGSGTYGFRGYFEKKPHFMQSVPFAIENLPPTAEAGLS